MGTLPTSIADFPGIMIVREGINFAWSARGTEGNPIQQPEKTPGIWGRPFRPESRQTGRQAVGDVSNNSSPGRSTLMDLEKSPGLNASTRLGGIICQKFPHRPHHRAIQPSAATKNIFRAFQGRGPGPIS